MLVLDHVFCMVPPDGDWGTRLAAAGWALDAGTAHPGQGTRNRRLLLAGHYLELLWVDDVVAARANPLRFDLRSDWRRSGASPFGFGLRGRPPEDRPEDFRRYDGLPVDAWVHRDADRAPERPLVVVIDVGWPRGGDPAGRPELLAVRHTGPVPADLPPVPGPPVTSTAGGHRLEVVVDRGPSVEVTDLLAVAGSTTAG